MWVLMMILQGAFQFNNMETYFGVISQVLDPDLYTIEVDIPGKNQKLNAFPFRGEVDEPRVGDNVMLLEVDPIYHSYYLYKKLKENDFIGIRSRGKKIWIKEDFIQIGIIPVDANNSNNGKDLIFPDTDKGEWYDDKEDSKPTPDCTSWIKIDKEGNLEVEMEGAGKVHITKDHEVNIDGNFTAVVKGNSDITVNGNTTIKVDGNVDAKVGKSLSAKVSGSCTIDSPDVKITGASVTVAGTPTPEGRGAWCGIPFCCFTGAAQSSSKSLNN